MARKIQRARQQGSAAWMDATAIASDAYEGRRGEMDAGAWSGSDEQTFGLEAAMLAPLQEDAEFGWMCQVDPATNRSYYIHSHTGEVRWNLGHEPASPRTNPWTMHEQYEDIGSPFFAGLVLLPSGVTPSQPHASRLESWRGGYKRFPMEGVRGELDDASFSGGDESLRRRVLPCTWEMSPHGPPFLSPFPVVVIQPIWKEEPTQASPENAIPTQDQWWSTRPPPAEGTLPSPQLHPSALFVPQAHVQPTPLEVHPGYYMQPPPPFPGQYPAPHLLPPPPPGPVIKQQPFKEHNRRGYNMRQARKLMKQLSLQAPITPQPPSPDQVPMGASHHHHHHPLQDQSSAIRVN